jgi:modification methylase
MAKMPDGFLDITITSPPYNLGKKHHTRNNRFDSYDEYNDNLPEEEYQETQIKTLNELFRVTKQAGSLFYNHKNRIRKGRQITPYEWLLRTDWVIKQEIVWDNGTPNFDPVRFYPGSERIYWLAKSPKTKLVNTINHHDIFLRGEWPPQGVKGQGAHNRSFPVKMVTDILSCFPEATIVYDPYVGSGTVAVGAIELGKHYIGSEISRSYVEIAQERIAEALYPVQPTLEL